MSANRVEKLIYWYLRFNGYFTIENFTVHPDNKKGKEAEADMLCVRFPFSREDPENHCLDRDESFIVPDLVDYLLVEVTSSKCKLNAPWTDDRAIGNISYAIRWMGFLENDTQIVSIAKEIHSYGFWKDPSTLIRFVCFGSSDNVDLYKIYPELLQKPLISVAAFLKHRLTTNCARLQRDKWDSYIREFAKRSKHKQTPEQLLAWTLQEE